MMAKSPEIGNGIFTFYLEDELLLFSKPACRLFRLNTSGAYIWCCLEEGLAVEAISSRLAAFFGISAETACQEVRGVLTQWHNAGLLAGGPIPPPPDPEPRDLILAEPARDAAPDDLRSPLDHFFQIAGHVYHLRFPDEATQEAVLPVLAHMERSPVDRCTFRMEIARGMPAGYVLNAANHPIARCDTLSELAPLVHGHFLLAACETPDCLAVIHAAAVSDGTRCLLFPGDTGSGKSTLAAGMAGSGFTYFSDEVAVLSHHPCRVRAVPLSISLKEGSWPALAPFFPEIAELPVFLRPDGKKVRYLSPPSHLPEAGSDPGLPVAAIVFPRYSGSGGAIAPVSQAEALCRIAKGGYDFSGRMEKEMVDELIAWISGIPCYEIAYSDLQSAVYQVKTLL